MQRVSSLLPSWERTRSVDGKNGAFGRVFGWADKIAPASRLTTSTSSTQKQQTTQQLSTSKIGREAYWPGSLDKECEKAARILKSFCTDGFLSYEPTPSTTSSEPASPTTVATPIPTPASAPATQTQIMKKIPPRIVQNAVGLAIFSCMRSGLWMSGSGGSGILIARKADGTWSPPSGILLHTASVGFAIGVDIYDCVLVINSVAALEMFTRSRLALGTDVALSVGPVASVGLLENDHARFKGLGNTVLTYLKARGQHRAVHLDGSLVTERGNENERFYGNSVEVLDILAGNINKSIPEIAPLFEAIKAAEGRTDFDVRIMQTLSLQPAPGDAIIETPVVSPASPKPALSPFGIPSQDDPDPFGVIALEMAGLEIREAGSRLRPTSTQFEYCPSPTSLVFTHRQSPLNNRQSVDTYISHSNSNRGSYMSSRTQATTMTDAFTQTDAGESARTSPSPSQGGDLKDRTSSEYPLAVLEPEEIDYTKVDMTALERLNRRESVDVAPVAVSSSTVPSPSSESLPSPRGQGVVAATQTPVTASEDSTGSTDSTFLTATSALEHPVSERDDDADDEDDEDDDEEEPIIIEVATASQPARAAIMTSQVTQVIQAKGALVTIPKRIPPALPARNPARSSRASKSDFGGDVSGLKSPLPLSPESPTQKDGCDDASLVAGNESAASQTSRSAAPAVVLEVTAVDDGDVKKHHRNTSSVYTTTTILPDTVVPATPSTPTTPNATDENYRSTRSTTPDDEPLTPRVFGDLRRPRSISNKDGNDDTNTSSDSVRIVSNSHLNTPTTIPVA